MSKRILIVGLGLIGGSYAMGLTKKGYEVYAIARKQSSINYAKEHDSKTIILTLDISPNEYFNKANKYIFQRNILLISFIIIDQ